MNRAETAQLRARIRALHDDGMSYRKIADALGMCVGTVSWYLKRDTRTGDPSARLHEPLARERDDSSETPAAARQRIARELAAGKRCTHQLRKGPCSLLLPCADHELSMGLAP